jgi:hypothetical protein
MLGNCICVLFVVRLVKLPGLYLYLGSRIAFR